MRVGLRELEGDHTNLVSCIVCCSVFATHRCGFPAILMLSRVPLNQFCIVVI